MYHYKIYSMPSYAAWENAIQSIITVLNREFGLTLTHRDWDFAMEMAKQLDIMFDDAGNIVKNYNF